VPRHAALRHLLFFLAFALPVLPSRACEVRTVAEMPLRNSLNFLTVPAAINGISVSLLLDTGAERGLVTPEVARSFDLPSDPRVATRAQGTGGTGAIMPHVVVSSLAVGGLELPPHSIPVGPLPAIPRIIPPVAGLLGGDVLAAFDVEIDVPHGRLALRTVSEDCDAPMRWTHETVPLRREGVRLIAPVTLDGHRLEALLDTGALSIALDTETAIHELDLSQAALARDPGGIAGGVDMREALFHWHRFGRLAIGGLIERNPVLTVTRIREDTPMLLGASWFAQHRAWLSYATARLFIAR
jgi:hypothetical protein